LRVRRTQAADADVDDIWSFIAADNEVAANRLVGRIEMAERRLTEIPEMGPARPELGKNVRS